MFRLHCSLDLLESACLICAMLLEVPSMAASPLNPKKRILSRSFHRILDTYNRQVGGVLDTGSWIHPPSFRS